MISSWTGAQADLLWQALHMTNAACAPVLHLRKVSGGSLVTVYTDCIERVWEQAKPWNGEDT
jgi:hypothetical protein